MPVRRHGQMVLTRKRAGLARHNYDSDDHHRERMHPAKEEEEEEEEFEEEEEIRTELLMRMPRH